MATDRDEPDDLIDAAEVAGILGLAHRNSVSTYRSRYADFPRGRRVPGGGRTLVWPRSEILAWHEAFEARHSQSAGEPNPRLEDLVAATTRLLLANPGRELSIRQIAAEAGVAHSDLYRYAESKERLLGLATARVVQDLRRSLPDTLEGFTEAVGTILSDLRSSRITTMRVMADQMIREPGTAPEGPLMVADLADLIARHRAETATTSEVEPRVLAACVGALAWGLLVLESRWTQGLDLEEIPLAQVTRVIHAMLQA